MSRARACSHALAGSGADGGHEPRRVGSALCAAIAVLAAVAGALPAGAVAEQASQPGSPAAGQLDVSGGAGDISGHTCARLPDRNLRCWGFGGGGRLGYGNEDTIGDDETPGAVGPVDLGSGLAAEAISAGAFHSCGLLEGGSVRCWGFGGEGRLGYANTNTIGDDETPGLVGPVDLGEDDLGERRTALAISAGGGHTCALLGGGGVRCWGFGADGRLGYANTDNIGDDETPGTGGPVDLGARATAITAGENHTCAVLDDGNVRCWGIGASGQLGYGNTDTIGDNEKPVSVGPVDLGGSKAKAISAGDGYTCAVVEEGSVRCWGFGANGRLGYGNRTTIGDNETPGSVGPVDLGGSNATAISAGDSHTCALLEGGSVRCWGFGGSGRLGYAGTNSVGDDEAPGSVGPVDLGSDRPAAAISAGGRHTCALLDDGAIRCWGAAELGRLGYCNANDIGDDETPGSVGPVNTTGSSGCPPGGGTAPAPGGGGLTLAPPPGATPTPETGDSRAELRRRLYRRALAAQASRRRKLRDCDTRVARHARREQRLLRRRDSSSGRLRAERHMERHRSRGRRKCRRRHGRTPGRVTRLSARAVSRSKIVLSLRAAGTDAHRPPAAREYVVKQSRRPISDRRGFRDAQTLCGGRCRFDVRRVGATIKLTVTDLRPRTAYYYSVAARDNVSGRVGPFSPTAKARTRG